MWDKGHQFYPRIKSTKRHPQPICCSVQTFIALIFLLLLSNISVIHIDLKTSQARQERGEGSKGFLARNFTLEAPIPPNAPEPQHAHPYCPVCTLADRLLQTWSTTSPWETTHFLRLSRYLQCSVRQWNQTLWQQALRTASTLGLSMHQQENLATAGNFKPVKGDERDTGWTITCVPLCSIFGAMNMLKGNNFGEWMSRHYLMPHDSCSLLWSNTPEDPLFIFQLNLF